MRSKCKQMVQQTLLDVWYILVNIGVIRSLESCQLTVRSVSETLRNKALIRLTLVWQHFGINI